MSGKQSSLAAGSLGPFSMCLQYLKAAVSHQQLINLFPATFAIRFPRV